MQDYLESRRIKNTNDYIASAFDAKTQFRSYVFDFLVELNASYVTKAVAKLKYSQDQIQQMSGSRFTVQFLLFTLYGGDIPTPVYYNHWEIMNQIKPRNFSNSDVIRAGDALTIAELIVKSYATEGDRELTFQPAKIAADAAPKGQLCYFNVLHDKQLELYAQQTEVINANPYQVMWLVQPIVSQRFLRSVFGGLQFSCAVRPYYSRQPGQISLQFCRALESVVYALQRPGSCNIQNELRYVVENYTSDLLVPNAKQLALLYSMISYFDGECRVFDDSTMTQRSIVVNRLLLKDYSYYVQKLAQQLCSSFMSNRKGAQMLFAIAPAHLIAHLALKHFEHISFSQIIFLRAFYDGPYFITQLLITLNKPYILQNATPSLLYYVFQLVQRLPWVYCDNDFSEETKSLLLQLNNSALNMFKINFFCMSERVSRYFFNCSIYRKITSLSDLIKMITFDSASAVAALMSEILPIPHGDDKFVKFHPSHKSHMLLMYFLIQMTNELNDPLLEYKERYRLANFAVLLCSKYQLPFSTEVQNVLLSRNFNYGVYAALILALYKLLAERVPADKLALQHLEETKKALENKAFQLKSEFGRADRGLQHKIVQLSEKITKNAGELEQNASEIRDTMQTIENFRKCYPDRQRQQVYELYNVPIVVKLQQQIELLYEKNVQLNASAVSLQKEVAYLSAFEKQLYASYQTFTNIVQQHKQVYRDSREMATAVARFYQDFKSEIINSHILRSKPFLNSFLAQAAQTSPLSPQFSPSQYENCLVSSLEEREAASKLDTRAGQMEFSYINASNESIVEYLCDSVLLEARTTGQALSLVQEIFQCSIESSADLMLRLVLLPRFNSLFPNDILLELAKTTQQNRETTESVLTAHKKYLQGLSQKNLSVEKYSENPVQEVLQGKITKLARLMAEVLSVRKKFLTTDELDFLFFMTYCFYHEEGRLFVLFSLFFTYFCATFLYESNEMPHFLYVLVYNYCLLVNILFADYEPPITCRYYLAYKNREIMQHFEQLNNSMLKRGISRLSEQLPELEVCNSLFEYIPPQLSRHVLAQQQKCHLLKIIQHVKVYVEHFRGNDHIKHALNCICCEYTFSCIGNTLFYALFYETTKLQKLWDSISRRLDDIQQKALSRAALNVVNDYLRPYSVNSAFSAVVMNYIRIKLAWFQ